MELASNSITRIITPKKLDSVTPYLTNSPITLKATLTGFSKNANVETLSPQIPFISFEYKLQ